jgi:hypothetical protein
MRHPDPDLVLVEGMLAPPALDDARNSLEYWQQRRKSLPVYRRGARREAKEMAARWEGRVRAARQARFESSPVGRLLTALGIPTEWIHQLRVGKRGLFLLAWAFVPPKVKLVAGAVAATWLIMVLAAVTVVVVLFDQLA